MDYRLLFPKKYLAAVDILEGKKATGRDHFTLTIARIEAREELKTQRGSEHKPALYFTEMEKRNAEGKGENKRLVLNITNAHAIAAMYGTEMNDWIGKRIALSTVRDVSFGKLQDRIVVLDHLPSNGRKPKSVDIPPPPDDEFDPVEEG